MRRRKTVADLFSKRLRSGYTLIEMLIAAVLVAALMSVVYGMMSMYNSYLTAGQSQAVEQQLIRSLLQLLEQDLQNIAIADTNPKITPAVDLPDELPSATTDFTDSLADPLAMSLSESVEGPSLFSGLESTGTPEPPGKISLAGNSSSFRLSIERPPLPASSPTSQLGGPSGQASVEPGADSAPQPATVSEVPLTDVTAAIEGTAPKVPEFQSIIWQFQAPGVIQSGSQSMRSGLYRIQADSLELQTALLQQNSLMEDRVPDDGASVDQMTMETLLFPPAESRSQTGAIDASGSQPVVAAPQFDLIPEVVGCRFEYFSGSDWTSSWNSELQNGLPVAVRIQLRLVTPSNLERLNQSLGTASSQGTLLDEALGDAAGVANPAIPSNPLPPGETDTDPFRMIPTRHIERIILLQPITGPMPQPGAVEESSPRLEQVSVGWNWVAQTSRVSVGRFIRISFPNWDQLSTVPSPPISGEKVADRPDEGAARDGRVRENPPHPNPLPQIVCVNAVPFYFVQPRNRFGGEGTSFSGNKFWINPNTRISILLSSPGWDQRLITYDAHHSAESPLPRFQERRWPTGRMRGFKRVAVCWKGPLLPPLSLTSFAATPLAATECSHTNTVRVRGQNPVVRYGGGTAS